LSIITAAGISGNTNPIRIFGNTDNIVVKNTIVSTGQSVSYAILITVRQTVAVGYAGTYVPDSIVVDNCDVTNTFGGAGQGIAISNSGTPASFPTGIVFKNNKINARTRGILLNNSGNTDVIGNEISVTQTSTGNLSEGIFALTIGTSTSVTNILNNKIQILSTANVTAGSYGIEGIQISSQGVYNVFNNIITGFVFPNLAQGIFVGIGVTTATTNPFTANIHYNSVYMANGSNTAGAAPPIQAAFYMKLNGASGTRSVNLMNNLFANLESDYATQAIFVDTANTATLVSNYNNLYSAGGSGMVGKIGPTNCATLADWQTAATQDANSVSGAPGFVSASDLHIEPTTYPVPVVSDAGTPIGAVTTDMDGDLRSASTPDIGADEFVANPTIPVTGFSVSPNPYDFGNVWKDSTMTDSVTVTNHSTTLHLVIDSVKSSNPLFSVTPAAADLDTSATKKFAVSFSPVAKGAQVDTVIFYHNAASAKDTLILTGMGIIKEPVFKASPATLNFSSVLAGHTKMDSVLVKNIGTDSLKISTVTSDNALFTVSPAQANLAIAESVKFYITFAPLTGSSQTGNIVFASNAATLSDTVKVSGSGLAKTSIKAARLLPVGTEVLFDGIATRVKGSYIYMQDTSAGIIIYQSSGAVHDSVVSGGIKKGDKLLVQGKTYQYSSLLEISSPDIYSVVVLSRDNPIPEAQKVTLKELATNGENYEAEVVKVIDVTVTGSGTFNAKTSYPIADTSDATNAVVLRMPNATDGDVDGTTFIPVITFTGVVGQFSSSDPAAGYQLMAIESDDVTDNTLNVNDEFSGIPKSYALYNNYPNPFNPSTTILYAIPQQSTVEVKVYSILGQEVKTLVNDMQSPSYYRVVWNGTNNFGGQVSSGVYFVRVAAKSSTDGKSFVQVKKMLMMK
ncbi:MAG: choice-of-anchor D domain-containing protein, partial [Bacteroidota bacterium]